MSADPLRIKGAATLYRHRRSGLYRIQQMCIRGRLGFAEHGDASVIDPGDEGTLVLHIDRALNSYGTNRYDPEGPPRYSGKEYSEFVRQHDATFVVRHEDGTLEITPWAHARGAFKPISAASLVLHAPIVATALASAIREAFERAQGE